MKTSSVLKCSLLGLGLAMATSAIAADKGSLHVSAPEEVAGERLAVGDYTVRWDDNGPIVQLRIMQGKKVFATARANAVTLQNASINDSVIVDKVNRGIPIVSRISFQGKKVAFDIHRPDGSVTLSGSN